MVGKNNQVKLALEASLKGSPSSDRILPTLPRGQCIELYTVLQGDHTITFEKYCSLHVGVVMGGGGSLHVGVVVGGGGGLYRRYWLHNNKYYL